MSLRYDAGCYVIVSAGIREYRCYRGVRYYNVNNYNRSCSIQYDIYVRIKKEKLVIFTVLKKLEKENAE